jgi:hypothetical protein
MHAIFQHCELPKNSFKANLKQCTFLITLYSYLKAYFSDWDWKWKFLILFFARERNLGLAIYHCSLLTLTGIVSTWRSSCS